MTSKDHNKLIGIFLLAHGGFQTLIMLLIGVIYGGLGAVFFFAGKNDEKVIGLIFIVVIIFVFLFTLALLLPQIIGGWKMLKERPNAKTWGSIGSILACLSFPFGTAIGVYGLWFLFGEEGKRFYENLNNPQYLSGQNGMADFQYQSYQQQQNREPHSWK